LGSFGIAGLLVWERGIFFGEEGCFLGLLAVGFGFLVGDGSTVGARSVR
jgi:hypothetical protein